MPRSEVRRFEQALESLTATELEALRGAALGETARETGRRLGKSEAAVKSRIRTARLKIGARNLPHAIYLCYRDILGLQLQSPVRSKRRPWNGNR